MTIYKKIKLLAPLLEINWGKFEIIRTLILGENLFLKTTLIL